MGEDDRESLVLAENYASSLGIQGRYGEAKALLRKTIPVARRVLGEDHQLTIKMRWLYAATLCEKEDATLDNLREAVTTLEETLQTARRVLGGGHPMRERIVCCLQTALSHLHDAVMTLDETELTTRRVLGSAHPLTKGIVRQLRRARAALRAGLREYRQTADLATLSVRGLKALVRERNLNIRYPIERSDVIAALAAPEEAGRWVFWEG